VLKAYIPPCVYEPGTTPDYLNDATSLAGYIVQRVGGIPFDDYIASRWTKERPVSRE